jgi:hypothetical protein
METSLRSEPFDGHHTAPGYLLDGDETGANRLPIEQDGTGSTLSLTIAGFFRSREVQVLAQNLKQCPSRSDSHGHIVAVETKGNLL